MSIEDAFCSVDTADGLVAALDTVADTAREENRAAARKVLAIAAFMKTCVADDLARLHPDQWHHAGRAVESDLALKLGLAPSAAHAVALVADTLTRRLPLLLTAFGAEGAIDYARVRIVCEALYDVSSPVLDRIEVAVVDAARVLVPARLTAEVERLLIAADPDEAARVRRKRHNSTRRFTITPDNHDMVKVLGRLTTTEGATLRARVEALRATVCAHDGRNENTLYADALMAVVTGADRLDCRCSRADCPARDRHSDATRTDATDFEESDSAPSSAAASAAAHTEDADAAHTQEGDDASDQVHPSEGDEATDETHSEEDKHDTDSHNADSSDNAEAEARPVDGIGRVIIELLAKIAADPSILDNFDGHGDHGTPPEGALNYRIGAALRRRVFARYPTCTQGSCSQPATRCELDHAIAFNHHNPINGGWTIAEDLHPGCKRHHQDKTHGHYRVVILPGGIVVWKSRAGAIGITLPDDHAPP